ncbi:amidase family protein [Mesorhizobium cantuariense]|uniref:Amidase family protein n=1 Tax=Mesorhizobium cantuariense TaxID=1300275 RepID=A0ABV7MH71_9HYPH
MLSGNYPGDPFIIPGAERPYVEELSCSSSRLRVGVALNSWAEVKLDPEIRDRVAETAKVLEGMGHEVEEIPQPFSAAEYRELIVGSYYLSYANLDAEASALGRKVDETTLEALNLIIYERAKNLPLSHAERVFEHARKIRFDVGKAIQGFDILLTPTMPCTALPHDAYSMSLGNMSADDLLTFDAALCQYLGIFSVTGQPSVSLPLFCSSKGLPVGIQIVGRFAHESTVVRVARDLEQAIPWTKRRPPLFAGITGQDKALAAAQGLVVSS